MSDDAVAAPATTVSDRKLRMLRRVVYNIVRTSVIKYYSRYLISTERKKEKRIGELYVFVK